MNNRQFSEGEVGSLPAISTSPSTAREIDEVARFMIACFLPKIEQPCDEENDGSCDNTENDAKPLGVCQAMPADADFVAGH